MYCYVWRHLPGVQRVLLSLDASCADYFVCFHHPCVVATEEIASARRAGVLILGSLGIFAKTMIDVEFLSRWSEAFVGAMLLGIGAWAARQTYLLHRQGAVRAGCLCPSNVAQAPPIATLFGVVSLVDVAF